MFDHVAITTLLGALAGAGCAAPVPTTDAAVVDAQPRQTVTLSQTSPPGLVQEGIWLATTGDEIRITVSAPTGLDWDIHAHNHGGTQDVASGFGQTAISYDFRPTESGPWYLLLRNSSTTTLVMDIRMDLYGGATWQGWQ